MKRDQYIMFEEKQQCKGKYRYVQHVKYRVHNETEDAFFLLCKDGKTMNKILKDKLKGKFSTGEIFRDLVSW